MALSRNGRRIVYTNQTPLETDILYTNMYNMVNASYLASAILGNANSNATLVSGLACTQNSSPNLSVNIGAGVMFNFEEFDATAYGVIPPDTAFTDFLYKPYIQTTQYNTSATLPTLCGGPLTFTPPGTGTTNYLLQATFLTTDTDSVSRPYFNSANPSSPIYQNAPQTRWDTIYYSLKSAASPTIPTPDAGYVGLYVISVASGATQILNNNISVYSGAPFITESLTQKLGVKSFQSSTPIYGADTGSANIYAMTGSPAYSMIQAGTRAYMKAANSNTGASTLNVSGLGAASIKIAVPGGGLQALIGGEMQTGGIYEFLYDGTQWQLLNPSAMTYQIQSSFDSASHSTTNTYTLNTSPPTSSDGQQFYSVTITPRSSTSILKVSTWATFSITENSQPGFWIIEGSAPGAVKTATIPMEANNFQYFEMSYETISGGTSPITFYLYAGVNTAAPVGTQLNLNSAFGSSGGSGIQVEEFNY